MDELAQITPTRVLDEREDRRDRHEHRDERSERLVREGRRESAVCSQRDRRRDAATGARKTGQAEEVAWRHAELLVRAVTARIGLDQEAEDEHRDGRREYEREQSPVLERSSFGNPCRDDGAVRIDRLGRKGHDASIIAFWAARGPAEKSTALRSITHVASIAVGPKRCGAQACARYGANVTLSPFWTGGNNTRGSSDPRLRVRYVRRERKGHDLSIVVFWTARGSAEQVVALCTSRRRFSGTCVGMRLRTDGERRSFRR